MKIKWSPSAKGDLAEITNAGVVWSIVKSTLRLVDYPLSGRPGRIDGTREVVNTSYPYVVIYKVSPNGIVLISRVMHTSRLFPEVL